MTCILCMKTKLAMPLAISRMEEKELSLIDSYIQAFTDSELHAIPNVRVRSVKYEYEAFEVMRGLQLGAAAIGRPDLLRNMLKASKLLIQDGYRCYGICADGTLCKRDRCHGKWNCSQLRHGARTVVTSMQYASKLM